MDLVDYRNCRFLWRLETRLSKRAALLFIRTECLDDLAQGRNSPFCMAFLLENGSGPETVGPAHHRVFLISNTFAVGLRSMAALIASAVALPARRTGSSVSVA